MPCKASRRRGPRSCRVLTEPAEQAIQLVERSEDDRDFAAIPGTGSLVPDANLHRSGQRIRQLLLETKNVACLLTFCAQERRLSAGTCGAPCDELLGLANAELFGDDLVGVDDLLGAIERQ